MTARDVAQSDRLDRRRVLKTALAIVDSEGLGALTMRRLAIEFGVDPMTVHYHARGKDGLLDGLAEILWEEIDLPEKTADPGEVLRTLARSIRGLFHRHPQGAPLLLRCSELSPAQLRLWRSYLDALDAGGVVEPAMVLRPVLFYALGTGHAEVAIQGVNRRLGPIEKLTDREMLVSVGQALPAATPPELAEAAMEIIADCEPNRCFNDGLELMLAGMGSSPARGDTDPSDAIG